MMKVILVAVIATLMNTVSAGTVKEYCEREWPGDYQTQLVCIKHDGKDVFAHNTFKYKYHKFRKHINALPAHLKTDPEMQYKPIETGVAVGGWTILFMAL